MSLYGALYSGVSGLKSQSNKIGIISDNISNVNTVGYKQGNGQFETLVTTSGLANAYSPGGALGGNRQQVSKQGLLLTTDSATDIAISGSGFFVVNGEADGTGQVLYTRAGSFRQDSLGNFRNAAGYYLQGWPLDREGNLPVGNSNLSSLQTVNVQSLSGVATSTTLVEVSANLKSSQTVYPGQSVTAGMDTEHGVNSNNAAKDILIPGGVNGLTSGDKFVVETGGGDTFTYRYGGFTYGRDVTNGANGESGVSRYPQTSALDTAVATFTTTATSNVVTVHDSAHGLQDGDVVTLTGVVGTIDGINASFFNQTFLISNVTANTYDITLAPGATAGAGGNFVQAAASSITRPFTGNILDATTTTQSFLGTTGTAPFLSDALKFTITTPSVGTKTFTYVASSPNTQSGQFNNLENLAAAISAVDGLTARVDGGRLYVSAVDANESVTFANVALDGDAGPPVLAGIDWVRELGMADLDIGDGRFSSLQGLADLINDTDGLSASIANPLSNSTLTINIDDPLDTIEVRDYPGSVAIGAVTITNATPFTVLAGNQTVTINHGGLVTDVDGGALRNGDIVTIDPTTLADYLGPVSAVNGITTDSANNAGPNTVVTINHGTHSFAPGDVVHIDPSSMTGYPAATIGGVPLSSFDGNFTVIASTPGVSFTISVVGNAIGGPTTGGAGNWQIETTYGGIPLTDFAGQFVIDDATSSSFTVQVPTDTSLITGGAAVGSANLSITPPYNTGSLVSELGIVNVLGAPSVPQTTGTLGPAYDPNISTKNMTSGAIEPQYSTTVRVYDALGSGHDLNIAFIKTGLNSWAAEVYAIPPSDLLGTLGDSPIASGTITFNGDGSLSTVDPALTDPITINWSGGADPSVMTFDWGTDGASGVGLTDGLSQFDSSYKINFVTQNGVPVGELTGVTFTEEGLVVANYSNGETQNLFKIPLATFANPDQLASVTGNVFQQTTESGEFNLREVGNGGAGKIQSSALESSNVELAEQLTDMVVAQRAYQANSRVISTTNQLLEELSQIIR